MKLRGLMVLLWGLNTDPGYAMRREWRWDHREVADGPIPAYVCDCDRVHLLQRGAPVSRSGQSPPGSAAIAELTNPSFSHSIRQLILFALPPAHPQHDRQQNVFTELFHRSAAWTR
jgi:hypothetical protein